MPPWKIAFRMIFRLHNFPEESYPQEHCPKDKLHTNYIFLTQESEIVVL